VGDFWVIVDRGEVAHELRELLSILDFRQDVQVVGDADEGADPDTVAAFGSGEGSDDDLVHHRAGTEEESAVEGPAGHFD
jgi:hypothetical protein